MDHKLLSEFLPLGASLLPMPYLGFAQYELFTKGVGTKQ